MGWGPGSEREWVGPGDGEGLGVAPWDMEGLGVLARCSLPPYTVGASTDGEKKQNDTWNHFSRGNKRDDRMHTCLPLSFQEQADNPPILRDVQCTPVNTHRPEEVPPPSLLAHTGAHRRMYPGSSFATTALAKTQHRNRRRRCRRCQSVASRYTHFVSAALLLHCTCATTQTRKFAQ